MDAKETVIAIAQSPKVATATAATTTGFGFLVPHDLDSLATLMTAMAGFAGTLLSIVMFVYWTLKLWREIWRKKDNQTPSE